MFQTSSPLGEIQTSYNMSVIDGMFHINNIIAYHHKIIIKKTHISIQPLNLVDVFGFILEQKHHKTSQKYNKNIIKTPHHEISLEN